MNDQHVIKSNTIWTVRIAELQTLLDEIKPRLVAEEAKLSERLASISAFEFRMRHRLEKLTRRLEKLEEEIRSLRRQLTILKEDFFFGEDYSRDPLFDQWRSYEEVGAAASGNFRYRETAEQEPVPMLTPDQGLEIKAIYRQLARRFHPDFALDGEDRAYRTGMMMAINAAYATGDLEKLNRLALEPDPQQKSYTDQELAEALHKEWRRCKRRLQEIKEELENLEKHPSSYLMRQADKLEAEGRDLLEELAKDLGEKIAQKMIQRDMLQDEIESFGKFDQELPGDGFADAVYDLGLEHVLVEDPDLAFMEWRDKHWSQFDLDDSDDESVWDELRKYRDRKRK